MKYKTIGKIVQPDKCTDIKSDIADQTCLTGPWSQNVVAELSLNTSYSSFSNSVSLHVSSVLSVLYY